MDNWNTRRILLPCIFSFQELLFRGGGAAIIHTRNCVHSKICSTVYRYSYFYAFELPLSETYTGVKISRGSILPSPTDTEDLWILGMSCKIIGKVKAKNCIVYLSTSIEPELGKRGKVLEFQAWGGTETQCQHPIRSPAVQLVCCVSGCAP